MLRFRYICHLHYLSLRACSIVRKIVIEILIEIVIEIVIEIGRRGSTLQKIVIEN